MKEDLGFDKTNSFKLKVRIYSIESFTELFLVWTMYSEIKDFILFRNG